MVQRDSDDFLRRQKITNRANCLCYAQTNVTVTHLRTLLGVFRKR